MGTSRWQFATCTGSKPAMIILNTHAAHADTDSVDGVVDDHYVVDAAQNDAD